MAGGDQKPVPTKAQVQAAQGAVDELLGCGLGQRESSLHPTLTIVKYALKMLSVELGYEQDG